VSAPVCLTSNAADASQCAEPMASSIPVADQAADAATATAAGAAYVDVTPWFCTTTVCPSVVNNMITAFDTTHVTVTYARYLADVVGSSAGIATGRRLLTDADIKAAVAASATQKTSSSPLRPPATVAARDLSPAYANGCLVPARDTTSPTCTFGDGKATKKVVLFGDSHAAQWMPALLDVASRGGFSVTVLTKGNCPAPIMTVRNTAYQRDFTECDTWREWALKKVVELKPDLVVISSTFHGVALSDGVMQTPAVEAAWDTGLAALIHRMQVGSTKVTVVSDVANHVQRVPDCVAANPTNLLACATPVDQGTLVTHQRDETAAVLATGATYLDVRPWFCDSTTCPSVIGGVITDFDESHLTATYSKYLGHALGVALKLES
ncbi:MAG: hypothetical protein JWM76_57, partial [Pseudonocardiales bacterium]|nr:hypothetical protein [Pseudonocardiales bacterium]